MHGFLSQSQKRNHRSVQRPNSRPQRPIRRMDPKALDLPRGSRNAPAGDVIDIPAFLRKRYERTKRFSLEIYLQAEPFCLSYLLNAGNSIGSLPHISWNVLIQANMVDYNTRSGNAANLILQHVFHLGVWNLAVQANNIVFNEH